MGTPTDNLLIENGSASSAFTRWAGGRGTFSVNATWGGATIKLQYLGPDGSTGIDIGPEVTFTSDGIGGFEVGPGRIAAIVSGGPPSGVYARVNRVNG